MKWYWTIACANAVDDPFVADSSSLNGYEGSAFWRGTLIHEWNPASAWFRARKPENDGKPDDVLQNHLGVPVYSSRLREGLESARIGSIQYLPIRVIRPNEYEMQGFAIANALTMVPALDRERADYDVYPPDYFLPERRGDVRGIRRIVLRHSEIRGHHIFRLQEFRVSLFVSETFKDVFEASQLTGYSFQEITVSYAA